MVSAWHWTLDLPSCCNSQLVQCSSEDMIYLHHSPPAAVLQCSDTICAAPSYEEAVSPVSSGGQAATIGHSFGGNMGTRA